MAARHGIERMYVWAKRITIFGFFLGVGFWIAAIILRVPIGLTEVVFPMEVGGVLWLAAWIVRGVAPRFKPSDRRPQ
jgi:hypothetical protein